ncbi:MAG TPA: hypothetical protein VLE69_04015 [Candidatus Saccharimonadales bacterium]|nr:hypothetical protein [Candidatus Saccharimonadales bacterium]
MNVYIILAVIAGLPLLLALLFRVNAILLFLGVAVGALLAQYIADDASLVVNSFFTHINVDDYVKLGLLILPVILTLLFLRKTLSPPQLVFHLLPLVITAAAFATLIISALPGGVQHDILANPIGKIADSSQNVLIAASSILTLLLAMFTMGHKGKRGKHH